MGIAIDPEDGSVYACDGGTVRKIFNGMQLPTFPGKGVDENMLILYLTLGQVTTIGKYTKGLHSNILDGNEHTAQFRHVTKIVIYNHRAYIVDQNKYIRLLFL